ncbi:MAG TPA: T9SS type A sorting domain-containing protein [Bacteroidia bacterium]|nr:T9SS type A sorting domain-containing protein [Bacteroidia bacterium]
MRPTLTLLSLLFVPALFAQTFNSPESVEYDGPHHRWIVGNNGAGTVSSFYPQASSVVPFSTGTPMTTGPHGIEILNGVVYCCDGANIQGYDIVSGNSVFSLNCGATFLNGITSDGVSTLFATDFTAKKIYRIVPANNHYNIMASTAKTPNGILYDGANNRCVFVTWGTNAPIQAISLIDSTISTLTATTLSNCDGVTEDHAGYWYVSSWGNNALNRFTPTFTSPTVVMSGLNGPADIVINTAGDSIAIPNSGGTTVVFYTNITTGISALAENGFSLFPNPASSDCTITFTEQQFNSEAVLFDATGRVVRRIRFNGNSLVIEKDDLEAGVYLLNILNKDGVISSKGKIVFN